MMVCQQDQFDKFLRRANDPCIELMHLLSATQIRQELKIKGSHLLELAWQTGGWRVSTYAQGGQT